jgi:hypothetical protein
VPETDPIPGAVIAVQTFGDFLGFNPHLHILVTDGCFYGNRGMFRVAPPLELKKLGQADSENLRSRSPGLPEMSGGHADHQFHR